jgi:hypothetical protein
MAASSWSSRAARSSGLRCAARTKGSVVAAKEDSEAGRKAVKVAPRPLCDRYDSRPLLKAKDPRGRAESERSSRK